MTITAEQAAKLLEGTTPGPWESSASKEPLPYGVKPRIYSADGELLAEVGNLTLDQDAWEANARLIAAAPDLARALIVSEAARKLAEERLAKAVVGLSALDKAAGEVARQGAVTGPQWSRLTVALLKARAAIKESDNG